jgi:hypothetical protein
MANNFSDYAENKILNAWFRNTTYTPATEVFVALFTASTGLETNLPTGEVSGGAYARVSSTFNTATAGTTVNGGTLTWSEATADWGTITHLAIADHGTNVTWGTNVNVLMWGTLTASKTVSSGDTFKISAGDLAISVE